MKKIIAILTCSLLLQFANSENIDLNLKIFLEGPFLIDGMIPYLNFEESIPMNQPYTGTPWYYEGTESVASIPSSNVVDWVLVDLVILYGPIEERNFELVTRKAAFIFTDGTIRDTDGAGYLSMNVYTTSGLYVCIHHRNHLPVISSAPVSGAGGIYSYDFTTGAGQALGGVHAIKELYSGIWGMFSADGNNSGQIDNNDKNEVWLPESGTTGYKDGDFNLDNFTDDSDIEYNWSINAGKGFPFTIRHPSIDVDCGDSITDIRDGKKYKTVQIGNQCWLTQNLNVGTMIPGANNMANDGFIEKYCYDNNTVNCDTYGGLYQWNEMMEYSTTPGTQGICPSGWHLPSETDWCTITQFIDPTVNCNTTGFSGTDVGIKMKSTTGWISGNGTNTSGFTALPSGLRYSNGSFSNLGDGDYFWSSDEYNTGNAWHRDLYYNNATISRGSHNKLYGFSVRCVKVWTCGDPLNDTRDGQSYNTIQVGEQCWMAENLNTGTMIPGTNEMANDEVIEKYCYDNNSANCETYGGLYQWDEMMQYTTQQGTGGICPAEWHIPTDTEWCTLTQFIDPTVDCGAIGFSGTDVGIKIKSTTGWNSGGNGSNTSGFTAFPGGYRHETGNFYSLGYNAYFSSSMTYTELYPWDRILYYSSDNVYRDFGSKYSGFSVRCLKDTPPTWSCGDPLNDTRDGQTYNTVQIGEQCWMVENLNIGEMIQGANEMTNNAVIEKYCYDNNTANCDTFGGLYQWDEMMEYSTLEGEQGICPTGWHLPSDAEWCTVSLFIDITVNCDSEEFSGTDVGDKMKSTSGWFSGGNGINSSGFSVLPGAGRNSDGSFGGLGARACFWSSTENFSNDSFSRLFDYNQSGIGRFYDNNIYGFSVRCLKDTSPPTWSCGNPLNDTRDGQNYNTVQIGEQCWMAENLKTTLYQNGDLIPNITLATERDNYNEGAYVWYNNDNSWKNLYGALYNWYAVVDTRGLCPLGWHMPEDYDWTVLTNYLGGTGSPSGKMLKSCRQVNSPLGGYCNTSEHPRWEEHLYHYGTDDYAFSGLPGGERNENGLFQQIGITGSWWSTTEVPSLNRAWARDLDFNSSGIFVHNESKFRGYSVRCLTD